MRKIKSIEDIYELLVKSVAVDLNEQFDRNFERKAFFNGPKWAASKWNNSRGSLMQRTGSLRSSIKYTIGNGSITFKSHQKYAEILNNGGVIKVTAKMKKYWWARYYEMIGSVTKSKKGNILNNRANERRNSEAQVFKNMALKPIGSTIRIPKRQFIGNDNQNTVGSLIKQVIDEDLPGYIDRYINDCFGK